VEEAAQEVSLIPRTQHPSPQVRERYSYEFRGAARDESLFVDRNPVADGSVATQDGGIDLANVRK
jgi:hypothetical protein